MFNLTLPSILFGSIFAILLAAIFHIIRGGDWKILLLGLIASLLGFWFGHFLGFVIRLTTIQLGPIYIIHALIGSLIALLFVFWLSQGEK